MASPNNNAKNPAKPADAAPAKPPTQMQLIVAAAAKKKAEKEAKAKSRPAPSSRGLGTPPFGSPAAAPHGNTHAKGGASGVARRTAPGA